MNEYAKPIPDCKDGTRPYWDACKQHRLVLPKCRSCDEVYFFPDDFCPCCLSEDIQWIEASGKGRIHTYSVVERPPSPRFSDDVPYIVAIIELEEGPRMMSNILEIAHEDIRIDMLVEVVFEDVTENVTIPKFRPVK
jgi:uncharacterized OB-fold protein